MNRRLLKTLTLLVFAGAALPASAAHGPLLSTVRDNWINADVEGLVLAGLVPSPAKKIGELTNGEVVQLTAQAGEMIMAQADLGLPPMLPEAPGALPSMAPAALPSSMTPAAARGVSQLAAEFQEELDAMGADLAQLSDRIYQIEHNNDSLAERQQEYLKRTGIHASGYSRGYVYNFRGFGNNAFYGPMEYNSLILTDLRLKSVPVPDLLFDARVRFYTTNGMYYSDPLKPGFELRWISLTGFTDNFKITAGDFMLHYTPLTLWNSEVPVFTMIEPTSYYRGRKDAEEQVFLNEGPDWRLRGFQASGSVTIAQNPMIGPFGLQVMGGPIKQATQFQMGDYFAGSQGSMSFFNHQLDIQGSGLMIWDDPGTANVPYSSGFSATWAKQYAVGSLLADVSVPFGKENGFSGSFEYAGADYRDDINNPLRSYVDWAIRGTGDLHFNQFHLTGKYLNVGPYFYSPGAQTNRFTPSPGTGYLSTNDNKDDFLIGYLNEFVFQSNSRPSFADFDRVVENMLPYGDATPNRAGWIFGFSAELGKNGWLKPQASLAVQMHEIQPNFVINAAGTNVVAVDSATNTAAARTYGDYEGALTLDFAKAFNLEEKTYQIAFDYKHQSTDLGLGNPFAVNTLIAAGDFTIPISGFDTVVASIAYQQAQSSGDEYVHGGVGDPPSLANYAFFQDTGSVGSYVYAPLNMNRNSFAFGLMYPLSKTIHFRGDWFINHYTWSDVPSFDRRDQIWRLTYEAWF